MIEYNARITSQEPVTEELISYINDIGGKSQSAHELASRISQDLVAVKNNAIALTPRSDHDALKRQVDTLKAQLAQLQATTKITPVLDTYLRRKYDPVSRRRGITIHPDYGDWILTSDVDQLHLSFGGLRAEVGRSIYIQTRKKVYLLANGHSFYGLPGTDSGLAVNQWLSNNTTYRFVRAGATQWLVTASESPYPWT